MMEEGSIRRHHVSNPKWITYYTSHHIVQFRPSIFGPLAPVGKTNIFFVIVTGSAWR